MKVRLLCFLLLLVVGRAMSRPTINVSTQHIAELAFKKGIQKSDIKGYEGSLLLQGMCELSLASKSDSLYAEAVEILRQFGTGEIKGGGSFISYEAGGSGAAFMAYHGENSLRPQVLRAAARMMKEQNRSGEGLMVPSWVSKENDQVFIDMAFAVTPFMLYAGLIDHNESYIDMAVKETVDLFHILYDSKTGLIHQGRGFNGKGSVSQDCWSRGNGWGTLALGSLAVDLPRNHLRRKEVESLIKQFYACVLKYQDSNGMWHQEMTDFNSYPESSGTGLLLYGMGKAIEAKILGKEYVKAFYKGLEGLAGYVSSEGSVGNACWSCLCPNKGTKEDYRKHPTYLNDAHAFGPVVLAFSQALRLGIREVKLQHQLGSSITQRLPRTYVRFVPERSNDIAWENDRIAFRVYSRLVKDKVGSGVDLWTKSVAYSVIDGWYALNDQGKDYHSDRGEGYDFYAVGKDRGCGGTAIWKDGKMYVSEPYANYRIIQNNEDHIAFRLDYQPYKAGTQTIYESKVISMVNGMPFYRVSQTIETSDGKDVLLAVGLTDFGKAIVEKKQSLGLLSLIETVSDKDGQIGTCVVADPAKTDGYQKVENEEYLILRVKNREPIVYYVGAGWSGDPRLQPFSKWNENIRGVSYDKLNSIYSSNR